MKKARVFHIIKGCLFLAIAGIFLTIKFYNLHLQVDDIREVAPLFWTHFFELFTPTWQNWAFGGLFGLLGIIELIEGVGKDGN